jgi:truncated hemoglobin YjbI
MPNAQKPQILARHRPDRTVPYPEIPSGTAGQAAIEAGLASEEWWRKEYPHTWLRNLQHAAAEAVTVEELRQIVAELIYVIARSAQLRWPL